MVSPVHNSFVFLIIDHNDNTRQRVESLLQLEMPQATILTADSAQEGFELALQREPDGIVIASDLPDLDGIELSRRFRGSPPTEDAHLILLSRSECDNLFLQSTFQAGIDGCCYWPVERAKLLAMVRTAIRAFSIQSSLRMTNQRLETLLNQRTEELWASEEAASILLSIPGMHILLLDPKGVILAASEALIQDLELDNTCIGQTACDAIWGDADNGATEMFQQVIQTKQQVKFEIEHNGTQSCLLYPVVDYSGRIIRIIAVIRPVDSESDSSETVLRAGQPMPAKAADTDTALSEQLTHTAPSSTPGDHSAMQLLLESMTDPSIIIDGRHHVLYANPTMLRLLGTSADAILSIPLTQWVVADETEENHPLLDLLSGVSPEVSLELQTRENTPCTLRFRIIKTSWINHDVVILLGKQETTPASWVQRESILKAVNLACQQFIEESNWELITPLCLQQLGEALHADRVTLFKHIEQPDQPNRQYPHTQWARDAKLRTASANLIGEAYDEAGLCQWLEQLESGKVLVGASDTFGPCEQDYLKGQNVRHAILVPIFANAIFWGYIRYDHCDQMPTHHASELEALHAASHVFGIVIQRWQAELALKQSMHFQETFVDTIPCPAFYMDLEGRYLACNIAFSQTVIGLPKREILGHRITDLDVGISPELLDITEDKNKQLLDTSGSVTYEASVTCADGTDRDFVFDKTIFRGDRGEPLGICGVMSDISEHKRTARELIQARQQEINIGFEIQNRLLLGTPPADLSGVQIATLSIPSKQIDGDFYDFIRYDEDHFDLLIGDVMGKGVSAAMLGAAIKTQFIRAISNLVVSTNLATLPTPEEVLIFVQEMMCKKLMSLNSFATGCYARFSLNKRRMDLVDFGHTQTIHYRDETQSCELLKGTNFPLGFADEESYEQMSVHLKTGDVLLFYSDGLVEAVNQTGECFGVPRLVDFVTSHCALEAESFSKELYSELIHFSTSVSFPDDLTYVIVRIEDPIAVPLLSHDEVEIRSDLSELVRLRSFLQVCCRKLPDVDVAFLSQLELGVSEAASNIMRHSYKGKTDQPILAQIDIYQDHIIITLNHLGGTLNEFQLDTPAFDGSQKHGLGLYFIRSCFDEVKYTTNDEGRNAIRLLKRFL